MGEMIMCDKICLGMMLTSSFLSMMSQSFLVNETHGRVFITILFFLEDLSFAR